MSYLEWVQNRMGYYWTEEHVNRDLEEIMDQAYDTVHETAQSLHLGLRTAAYVVGIRRVISASEQRGLYA